MQKQKRTVNKPKKANKITNKQVRSVSAPSARSYTIRTGQPQFKAAGNSIRVHHREYLCELHGHDQFQVTGYAVNPGLSTFPWLSGVASRYEFYLVRSLAFQFVPRCPTSTSGTVVLAVDRDVLDSNPTDFRSIMSYDGAQSGVPWNSLNLRPRLDPTPLRRYVRQSAVSTGDTRLYDWGKVLVASQGNGTVLFGDVYMDYDIEFSVPEMNSPTTLAGVTTAKVKTQPSVKEGPAPSEEPVVLTDVVAEAVGEIGQQMIQGSTFSEAAQNVTITRVVKPWSPALSGDKFTPAPKNVGASTVIQTLLLPDGSYHFRMAGKLILMRTIGPDSYFALTAEMGSFSTAFLNLPGGLYDGATNTSSYRNVVAKVQPTFPIPTLWSGTDVSGSRVLYKSPTITLGSSVQLNYEVDFDVLFDAGGRGLSVTSTAPVLDFKAGSYNAGFTMTEHSNIEFEVVRIADLPFDL